MKAAVITLIALALLTGLGLLLGAVLDLEDPDPEVTPAEVSPAPVPGRPAAGTGTSDRPARPDVPPIQAPAPAAGAPAAPAAPAAADTGVVFEGRVVTADGEGVEGARVAITFVPGAAGGPALTNFSRAKTETRSTTSDPAGSFSLGDISAGTARVNISAADHHALVAGVVVPPAGLRGQKFTLKPALAIRGRVVDGAGNPVELARVNAARTGPLSSHGGALSDRAGAFVVDGLDPGPHRLTVHALGFSALVRENVPAGGDALEIVLASVGSVRGRVTRAGTGKPVEKFQIRFGRTDTSSGEVRWSRNSVAGRDGEFRAALEAGSYRLVFNAEGLPTTVRDGIRILAGRETAAIGLVVGDGGRIAGRVAAAGGMEVTGGRVSAVRLLAGGESDGHCRGVNGAVEDGGRFELGGLAAGTWRVSFESDTWFADPIAPLRVAEGAVVPLVIVARRAGSLIVRVTMPSGEAATQGNWSVTDARGRNWAGNLCAVPVSPVPLPIPTQPAKAEPGFSVGAGMAPGAARIEVSVPGCADVRQNAEIRGGDPTRIHIRLRAR